VCSELVHLAAVLTLCMLMLCSDNSTDLHCTVSYQGMLAREGVRRVQCARVKLLCEI